MVCFKYAKENLYSQVFPLSSFKPNRDKLDDPRFAYIHNGSKLNGKIVLIKPMLIPTKLLKVIDFHKEISSCNNAHIKE
jgi:hypothetical protein